MKTKRRLGTREIRALGEYRERVMSEFRIRLSEKVMRAGYVIREELVNMGGGPPIVMRSAFTPNGDYIGDPRDARYFAKRGIIPQLRTPTSNVCTIGYCARERKWYGWSHRAIFGFKIGSKVGKGSVLANVLPIGYRATTLADAKRMAELFAESVS